LKLKRRQRSEGNTKVDEMPKEHLKREKKKSEGKEGGVYINQAIGEGNIGEEKLLKFIILITASKYSSR
jgi:hypothetical protein